MEIGAFEFQWRERRQIFRLCPENGAFELQVGTKQGHYREIPGARDVNSPLEIYIPGRDGSVVENTVDLKFPSLFRLYPEYIFPGGY